PSSCWSSPAVGTSSISANLRKLRSHGMRRWRGSTNTFGDGGRRRFVVATFRWPGGGGVSRPPPHPPRHRAPPPLHGPAAATERGRRANPPTASHVRRQEPRCSRARARLVN